MNLEIKLMFGSSVKRDSRMKSIPQLIIDHDDNELMKNHQRVFNPSSIQSFGFNGVIESFLVILGFDFEQRIHVAVKELHTQLKYKKTLDTNQFIYITIDYLPKYPQHCPRHCMDSHPNDDQHLHPVTQPMDNPAGPQFVLDAVQN